MFAQDILLDLLYIAAYSAACAIYLPLPSEAPMFLFPRLSRIAVLLACAFGKALGAYFVFATGDRFRQTRVFEKVMTWIHLNNLWTKLSALMERFMRAFGFFGFLVLMSVPGMPMRSAIYSVSLLRISAVRFAFAVAIGTTIRNAVVYWGFVGIKRMF